MSEEAAADLADRLRVYYLRNALDHMVQRAEEVAERYHHEEEALWRKLRAKYGDDGADLIRAHAPAAEVSSPSAWVVVIG